MGGYDAEGCAVHMHELKTLAEYYDAVDRGDKTFEIRIDDRGFAVGDVLYLVETRVDGSRTGRSSHYKVTYLTEFSQQEGWVVMAIVPDPGF